MYPDNFIEQMAAERRRAMREIAEERAMLQVARDHEDARPTVIALRYGDPVVRALAAAGPGPVVIARVLPFASHSQWRGATGTPAVDSLECRDGAGQMARVELAQLVGPRQPEARLVILFGDVIERVADLAGQIQPSRIIAAHGIAGRLAATIETPVICAENGLEVRQRRTPARIVARARRAISGPPDEKVSALQSMKLFRDVRFKELRKLGSVLDTVEVGPGYVLVREGRWNETLWILLDGAATRSRRDQELGRLGPNAVIGTASLIYHQPAIATVTAAAPTRALVAGRAQFMAILAMDAVALRLRADVAEGGPGAERCTSTNSVRSPQDDESSITPDARQSIV